MVNWIKKRTPLGILGTRIHSRLAMGSVGSSGCRLDQFNGVSRHLFGVLSDSAGRLDVDGRKLGYSRS